MALVSYDYDFQYRYDEHGEHFPILTLRIMNPEPPQLDLDIDAYLDSGAQASLFCGTILPSLGIDLLSGKQREYRSASGVSIQARVHRVVLNHPDLGTFQIDAGFSESRMTRNLLGRDFFDFIQVGFREHQLEFFINPSP